MLQHRKKRIPWLRGNAFFAVEGGGTGTQSYNSYPDTPGAAPRNAHRLDRLLPPVQMQKCIYFGWIGQLLPDEMQKCICFLGFLPHVVILAIITALLQDSSSKRPVSRIITVLLQDAPWQEGEAEVRPM